MKKDKNIKNCLLILSLCLLVITIVISFSSRNVITSAISKYYTREKIVGNLINKINEESTLNSKKIETLQNAFDNDPSIDNISKKYFDKLIDYYVNNKDIENVDIKEDLIELSDKCIEIYKLKECQVIKDNIEKIDLNNVYEYGLYLTEEKITPTGITILKIYSFISSTIFKTILIILLILTLLIIYLINKKNYEYLLVYSHSMYALFISSIILLIIVNLSIKKISQKLINTEYSISFTYLYIISFVILIIGILLNYLYSKKFKNNK